jgi:hypothetical protein
MEQALCTQLALTLQQKSHHEQGVSKPQASENDKGG